MEKNPNLTFNCIEITDSTPMERAMLIAERRRRNGTLTYIFWRDGVPVCPICHTKIDNNWNCPCDCPKAPDERLDEYLKVVNTDIDSLLKKAPFQKIK